MKKQLRIMRAVAFATYKEWSAYRSHSLVSLFVGPAYFLVQVFIWRSVYSGGGTINGMTLDNMLMYYAIATLLNYLIMDFADWNLQMLIRTGKYTTFILRPVSHIYFALSQKVGHRILGFIFEFLPVYLIITLAFDIRLVPANFILAVISVVLGYLMMFLLDYCIGITGFWLIKTDGVRRVFLLLRSLCSGSVIPLMLFPPAAQRLLFFLPFQYVTYVPVRVFIGSYELGGISMPIAGVVAVQAVAVAVMSAAAMLLLRAGEKVYTGVGA